MEEFDAIVVGAGPAGLVTAAEMAKQGVSTAVIEKSRAIGYPIHDSAGSFVELIKDFNLSDKVIANLINGVIFVSPNGNTVDVKIGDGVGCVLERRELNRELAKIAVEKGAIIRMPEKLVSPIVKEGKLVGIETEGIDGKKEYSSKIIIDATGVSAEIAKFIGIHPGMKNIRRAVGAQYEMSNVELESPDFIEIYFGNKIAPGGYGWIFPKGNGLANVGVGILHGQGHVENPHKYLHRFIKEHPISSDKLKRAQPIEYHTGTFPIGPMLDRCTADNFMAVGDAACQGSPHMGEGIRFVAKCGKIAGEEAAKAIFEKDTSQPRLGKYEKRVRKEAYSNYDLLYKIHLHACSKSDNSWENTIQKLEKLSGTESGREMIRKIIQGDINKWYLLTATPKITLQNLVNILVK